ncbi:unnamed protein product [Schistosoma mattheei]|uniref:Uncharacterized protein n=1 Tax=Schistosoma mattheei TaxID=31246 RepID=A0A183PPP8_9TREM|nr:unnamed protein product [Schistosoma mattheei]
MTAASGDAASLHDFLRKKPISFTRMKKPRNIAVKSDVKEKHNQVSKCEKLSSQTEVSLLLSTDKSKSPDLRHIPIWLRKSLKFVQNCFLEAPPKLTDSSPHNANKEDGNAPPNTFQVVHKSLKSAKANISGNLEEIFSKLGLEQWIKEYENAHDESVNENSSKDQHIIRNCSTNSKSPSLVSNKGFSQIGIHGRPTVLKNNHHEYPIRSCYPRSSSNCSKCLNELPMVEKQNRDAVLKQNIIRCDDINFGLIGRNEYEVGPESQKIHRWLDENTYLMSGLCQPALTDTCNKKRKHTTPHKSDVKYVNQQENTKHMDSALNIVSPPMHPIWDTPEDLRTSSLTDFLRL